MVKCKNCGNGFCREIKQVGEEACVQIIYWSAISLLQTITGSQNCVLLIQDDYPLYTTLVEILLKNILTLIMFLTLKIWMNFYSGFNVTSIFCLMIRTILSHFILGKDDYNICSYQDDFRLFIKEMTITKSVLFRTIILSSDYYNTCTYIYSLFKTTI